VWFTAAGSRAELKHGEKVGDGADRTKGGPHGYALNSGGAALLFDATLAPDAVAESGVKGARRYC
jgi:hypothetical protein